MADELSGIDDVDRLWSMLTDARRDGDHGLADRVRARMRQLENQRRFADVSDRELNRRIAALQSAQRVERIKRAGVTEESVMNKHVDHLNERMSDAVRPPAADHLAELLAERQRRSADRG